MYTDPTHLRVEDPGEVENNPVFIYLDAFCNDRETLNNMREHYKRGGLGDIKVKRYLNEVLQAELEPIRNRRNEYKKNMDFVYTMLKEGIASADKVANETLNRVKKAIDIDFMQGK